MKTTYTYFIKLILITLAIGFLLLHIHDGFSWNNIPLIIGYIILGFWFGKITCSMHSKKTGFWITVSLFILLNLFHSLIDGVTLTHLSVLYKNIAIYSHELLRQPALYIVFWSMLQPFLISKSTKMGISIIAITGVWILGMYLGTLLGASVQELHINDVFLELLIFIFIGDIIHHLYDEFPGKKHAH
jgi:hypothetical protein